MSDPNRVLNNKKCPIDYSKYPTIFCSVTPYQSLFWNSDYPHLGWHRRPDLEGPTRLTRPEALKELLDYFNCYEGDAEFSNDKHLFPKHSTGA